MSESNIGNLQEKLSQLTLPAMDENNFGGSLKKQLTKLLFVALQAIIPDGVLPVKPIVVVAGKFGDYECNNAMSLWSLLKGNSSKFKDPYSVAQAIMENLPKSQIIESCSVAKPGYVNIFLSKTWIADNIQKMLTTGIEIWAPRPDVQKAVVDFSSPNIAKEMHVGHLRSTIIGDTIARMLEFSNIQVLRRNHVGDWGTQFGMLIESLFEECQQIGQMAIDDLQEAYKKSKEKFDEDPVFKERAQRAVVRLQRGEARYLETWTKICEISREKFKEIYERLNIQNLEEKGESYYNEYIPSVLQKLEGLIEESDGARVIFIQGEEVPLIVVKSDGGYNYSSTDLTALWYRLNVEKADWIIYVTDVGQKPHFDKIFSAARQAGWLPDDEEKYPRTSHVQFGVVVGDDRKKFRTRAGEVVRLSDLLDEAKSRSKAALVERGKAAEWTVQELDATAEAVGYGAVKYADLKNNRLTDYTFSFNQMLNDKGNTAVYLLYAHARICSIIRNSRKDMDQLKKNGAIVLACEEERALGLQLLQFAETVEEACASLLPNVLCAYLYQLSEYFTSFYTKCQVVLKQDEIVKAGETEKATEISRLLLCEATSVVMKKCFELLGIEPVDKI